MSKKLLFTIFTLVALSVVLGACGPTATPAATQAPAAAATATRPPAGPATAAPTAVVVAPTAVVVPTAAPVAATCTDKIGCLTIGATDPIHVAYMLVVSGPNSSLGIDSRRGIEIAVDDKGGKIAGHTVKLDGQDGGCSADTGQTAGTKLAADKTIVAL